MIRYQKDASLHASCNFEDNSTGNYYLDYNQVIDGDDS